MCRGGKRKPTGSFIPFLKLRVACFLSLIQIFIPADQVSDLPLNHVPVQAHFLVVSIPADQDAFAAVVHETAASIRECPAPASDAVLIFQIVSTFFGVRLRIIKCLNPHLAAGET